MPSEGNSATSVWQLAKLFPFLAPENNSLFQTTGDAQDSSILFPADIRRLSENIDEYLVTYRILTSCSRRELNFNGPQSLTTPSITRRISTDLNSTEAKRNVHTFKVDSSLQTIKAFEKYSFILTCCTKVKTYILRLSIDQSTNLFNHFNYLSHNTYQNNLQIYLQ